MALPTHWVLLPGFDGTGLLFEPLRAALPKDTTVSIISYPNQTPHSYQELVQLVVDALPEDTAYVLIAESFSGPVAIRVAATAPVPPCALVLCASFARCPVGLLLAAILRRVGGLLFRLRPPEWFVRRYLLGADAPSQLTQDLYRALASVSAPVLRSRLDLLLRVNVVPDLAALPVPVLYIRGSRDRLVGARSLRVIQGCSSNVEIETVNAPHLVLQREPERCVQLIRRYLDDHEKLRRYGS
jgi:pimeloyl-ACP methyl ester carboxylesterase